MSPKLSKAGLGSAAAELPAAQKKTDTELTILRNIEALEAELSETVSLDRKQQLKEQIEQLKNDLQKLQGRNSATIYQENDVLKQTVASLQTELNVLRLRLKDTTKGIDLLNEPTEQKEKELRLRLYKILLRKFAGLINENQRKTVGELKALINPEDLSVQSLVSEFKPESYDFSRNYLQTARKIFHYVTEEINYVPLDTDVNFWLAPKEVLTEKLGDDEDLAVLLCSILSALGDEKAYVAVAELENLQSHAIVITEFGGQFILLDPSQKLSFDEFIGHKANVMKRYNFRGSKIRRFLYRFNRELYEHFVEEPPEHIEPGEPQAAASEFS